MELEAGGPLSAVLYGGRHLYPTSSFSFFQHSYWTSYCDTGSYFLAIVIGTESERGILTG